jgi:hypothetical protein
MDKKLLTASKESFFIVSGAPLSLYFTEVDLYVCCTELSSTFVGESFDSFLFEFAVLGVVDKDFGSLCLNDIHHSPTVGIRVSSFNVDLAIGLLSIVGIPEEGRVS